MTDTAHATPGPIPPQQHRSHGCLWGCLIAALIAIVAIIGAFSYWGWYLYSGFKNDPALQNVMHVVNGGGIARTVLGDNIELISLSSTSINSDLNTGKTATYVAQLRGSKGQGTLAATVETPRGGTSRITVLMLTGPDGRKYDLMNGNAVAPPDATPPAQAPPEPTPPGDTQTDTEQGHGK